MSLFADFETVSLQKKVKATTAADWLSSHIDDQRRILEGEEVKTSSGKTLKKLWWDKDRNVIDVRFGRYSLEKGKCYKCHDEETFKKFLNQLEDFENNKVLKAVIESIHQEVTKPKFLKSK